MSLGLITIFTLPTSPEKTKWLNEEERALAIRRLEIEHLGTTHEPTTTRLVIKAILNWRTWLAVAGYSFINVIVQGTSIFLPTIISGLGKYTATQVQLRSVPPYIVASAWAFGISYFAWKTRVHGYFVAGSTVLSIVGYIMFLASKDPKVLYGASFLTFTGARASNLPSHSSPVPALDSSPSPVLMRRSSPRSDILTPSIMQSLAVLSSSPGRRPTLAHRPLGPSQPLSFQPGAALGPFCAHGSSESQPTLSRLCGGR